MSTIDPLPPPPDPSDSASIFNSKAFAFFGALPAFQEQTNVVAGEMEDNRDEAAQSVIDAAAEHAAAEASALIAQGAATTAAMNAGAASWVSGSYVTGAVAYSPSNGLIYRRKAPGGASPTDPAADPTNWNVAVIAAPVYRPETGASANAEVNVDHGLRYAGAQELVMPAAPAVGDIFWVRVENGRTDSYLTTGGAKINGEVMATLTLDDPYAALACRYTGSSYGWSI
ncbi:MAG: hypothetical protein EOP39_04640 [Rubrivivax sp.]|nr:MAG: hypothetical protein EOP39_04640 [Rubrivivax sp.]